MGIGHKVICKYADAVQLSYCPILSICVRYCSELFFGAGLGCGRCGAVRLRFPIFLRGSVPGRDDLVRGAALAGRGPLGLRAGRSWSNHPIFAPIPHRPCRTYAVWLRWAWERGAQPLGIALFLVEVDHVVAAVMGLQRHCPLPFAWPFAFAFGGDAHARSAAASAAAAASRISSFASIVLRTSAI